MRKEDELHRIRFGHSLRSAIQLLAGHVVQTHLKSDRRKSGERHSSLVPRCNGAIESSEIRRGARSGTRAAATIRFSRAPSERESDNYKEIECERAAFIGCDRAASHRTRPAPLAER